MPRDSAREESRLCFLVFCLVVVAWGEVLGVSIWVKFNPCFAYTSGVFCPLVAGKIGRMPGCHWRNPPR
eukprot:6489284-Amphidinium_carterae.2